MSLAEGTREGTVPSVNSKKKTHKGGGMNLEESYERISEGLNRAIADANEHGDDITITLAFPDALIVAYAVAAEAERWRNRGSQKGIPVVS